VLANKDQPDYIMDLQDQGNVKVQMKKQ